MMYNPPLHIMRNNSRWITAPYVKEKTMKLLKESTGTYFHDFWIDKGFLQLKKHYLLKKKTDQISSKYTIKENTNCKLRENIQYTSLIKNLYPNYTKNSFFFF